MKSEIKKGRFIHFVKSSHKRIEKIIKVVKGDENLIKTRCSGDITREYYIKYIERESIAGNITIK